MRDEKEFMLNQVTRQMDKIVTHLRDLADRVEHEKSALQRKGLKAGYPHAGYAAANVVNALGWGIANAPTETLITTAADFDVAFAKEAPDSHAAAEQTP